MVKGDPGVESDLLLGQEAQGGRTGAAPGRWTLRCSGAARAKGLGVHICTGPVAVKGAEPGDILEVRILDVQPRPSRNPKFTGKSVRQQRRRVVGLPLQRPDRGAQDARGHHDLRGGRQRRARLGQGALQLPLDAADRPVRRGAQDHRLPGRAGRPQHDQGELGRAEERARADPAAFRDDGPGAGRGGHGRLHPAQLHRRQHRQLAHRQGRHDVLPGRRCPARCSRSAIRTPRRATPSCAERPSSARSPAPSS